MRTPAPAALIRIVLDTSIFVAALRSSRGAAAQILALILSSKIIVCMDYKLSCEYREVAMRIDHRIVSNRSEDEVEVLIQRIERAAEPVMIHRRYRPLSIDPTDDMILEVAINGRVDAIVTHNLKHLADPAARFGIPVLTAAAFLQLLGTGE